MTLKQILSYGAVAMLKHGPLDNLADAKEYLTQGDPCEQENAKAIMNAIVLMEVLIIASPDEGKVILDHLNNFSERHK